MPWAKSFCPLPLLYPSASDFQFRYAPVTVGSGRAAYRSFGIFQPYRSKVFCLLINLRSKSLNGDFVVV